MPYTTYAELKAAIADRVHRTDLTSVIVDAVTMAEKRINHDLQLTDQEKETELTATIGSTALTLPSDFGSPIALYLTTYPPRYPVRFELPENMQEYTSNAPARAWTIDGAAIKTDSPADIAYTYDFRYSLEYDLATSETNALLTNYPDLYFYGALIEVYLHTHDHNNGVVAKTIYNEAMDMAKHDTQQNRALMTLDIDAALMGTPGGKRNRIFEGY